ncbi:hypothetical protein Vadar_008672 [Vaccinium darrowii]|uniref:Uncharacterized protein n=1 Tax=Vaccinium darrowii TaxID=229202 RepID=A0ACB7ZJ15_9ERIC|nr:hypothetical protein Vadar_008672 [Vaccinium darrowii]
MTTTSSSSTTIPPTLAFLVSNFHSLVNIKLDSGNFLLWKTQILNAFRANGYLGFLDGTATCPSPTIVDSGNHTVVSPEFTLWTLIDNQLFSCLTSSLSSTTLPHVLGLVHASQVWYSFEQRFNSLTRSHRHDLKSKLYNVTKTSSMDDYIDAIRDHAQRLEAVGHHVEDDDQVFRAINGLHKEEFRNLKTSLRTRGSDLSFEELATVLKSEEFQIRKDEFSSAKVFVATTKFSEMSPTSSASANVRVTSSFAEGHGQSSIPSLGQISQGQSSTQMYQPLNSQGSFFPQNSSGFNRNNRGKGVSYGSNQKTGCQICGKTNHTAFYCYQRQNLQYQPPPFMKKVWVITPL